MELSVDALIAVAIPINIAVLGYLVKRTISRSDEDRREMQAEARASHAEFANTLRDITEKNSEQHNMFFDRIRDIELDVKQLKTECEINHRR